MSSIDWVAIFGGIPTLIAAITGLILAIKGNATAKAAANLAVKNAVNLQNHQIESHDKLN